MVAESNSKNYWRIPFYVALFLCFASAAYINKYGILPPANPIPRILAAIAFCGTIGLLADYAFRIKNTWFWLIPTLVATEFFGDLVYNAGWWDIAKIIYTVSAFLWPVYGVLFIFKGTQLIRSDKALAVKLIVLGLLASAVLGWEYVTYFPQEFNKSHWAWRLLYLAIFGWLVMIDWTTDFSKRPNLKVEMQILRVSMLLIAVWYFLRFIFQ